MPCSQEQIPFGVEDEKKYCRTFLSSKLTPQNDQMAELSEKWQVEPTRCFTKKSPVRGALFFCEIQIDCCAHTEEKVRIWHSTTKQKRWRNTGYLIRFKIVCIGLIFYNIYIRFLLGQIYTIYLEISRKSDIYIIIARKYCKT